MNAWRDIDPSLITPELFVTCVEIPKYGRNKYELDKKTGLLRLDRILYTSTHYPQNYGFIPLTYAEDNDPLDCLLIMSEPVQPLTLVQSRPIGMVDMIDQGKVDTKILAVCPQDPFYASVEDIDDLPKHVTEEISHFFEVYKVLEGKTTKVPGVQHREDAIRVIRKNIQDYLDKFGK
jgi:inorganic pyrophosphatase